MISTKKLLIGFRFRESEIILIKILRNEFL